MSNYYTKQELENWLITAPEHELRSERERLLEVQGAFYKALNEVEPQPANTRRVILECIDDLSEKMDMIYHKIMAS